MKVLITGASGFIGKNLILHLSERKDVEILTFTKEENDDVLEERIKKADFIFHLAGINRPKSDEEFKAGNADLTLTICNIIRKLSKKTPVLYTSSIQAEKTNPYGISKKLAEDYLLELSSEQGNPVFIYRLPNVFGKWCKPNYNSVVATFCYNILNDQGVQVNDPSAVLNLVYVDDVIEAFLSVLDGDKFKNVEPVYVTTVGDLKSQIEAFKDSKNSLLIERVGIGLSRALYSTYISYFTPNQFKYSLVKHEDPRGVFVEMLKTKDSGQFSFFTAHPGITRGGHYHHTKNEKFLVISGEAKFGFRHMMTGEKFEILTKGSSPEVVETIPGWTHDVTNIGKTEMVVMLWANEIFDRSKPDTITSKV